MLNCSIREKKVIKIDDYIKEYEQLHEIEVEYDDDAETTLKLKWFDQGVLLKTETVFEGYIYDDQIDCNPVLNFFNSIEDSLDTVKDYIINYFEESGLIEQDGIIYTGNEFERLKEEKTT